jgi:hypothetical protein
MAEHYCETFHVPKPHRFKADDYPHAHAECLHCYRPAQEHVCGKVARFFHCERWYCAAHYDERIAFEEAIQARRLDTAGYDGDTR